MSSMRNAVQRRNHKERAQPRERERWGLLEKHKDYALRAKDYNAKKKKLKALRQKAAERNPDEFHFAMMSHQFRDDGTKTSKNSPYASMPHATAQLLKTQDAGYLRTMIQTTRKARQRLREDLVLQQTQHQLMDDDGDEDGERPMPLGVDQYGAAPRRHIVFVDDRAQQKTYDRHQRPPALDARDGVDEMTDAVDEDAAAIDGRGASSRSQGRARAKAPPRTEVDVATRQQAIAAQKSKLEATREREEALVAAEHELELQRAKMGNSIGGVTKAGHTFKIRQRKR